MSEPTVTIKQALLTQVLQALAPNAMSKAALIRALDAHGFKKVEITQLTGFSYQYVYNVLSTPVGASHV